MNARIRQERFSADADLGGELCELCMNAGAISITLATSAGEPGRNAAAQFSDARAAQTKGAHFQLPGVKGRDGGSMREDSGVA